MAGHSKWANIKFRKAAQDNKRGKLFTKLIKEITVSSRQGGGDVASNPRLRAAVEKALSSNMTRDTVERAVKRGTGELEGVDYEEIRYEGYAPAGVAILVDCTTDNKNRTVGEVRHAFSKYGGNLGTDGSVSYLFSKVGWMYFNEKTDEDQLMELAIDAGAEDVVVNDDKSIEVMTSAESYNDILSKMHELNMPPEESEIMQKPATEVELNRDDAEKVMKLINALEELDDVQDVFTNASFPDDFEG